MRPARLMPYAMRRDVMTPHLAMAIGRRRRFGEIRIRDAMLIVDPEHALDAADHTADRGADHGADRPRDAAAFVKSMRGAARDALRLRRQRRCDRCDRCDK